MIDAFLAQIDRVQMEQRLEFAALPEGWSAVGMVVLAGALGWAIVWMYRHEGRAGATSRVRLVMASVRCVVVAILLCVWLEPVLATYLHRWIDSYTLVLVDTSSSMDLQDRYRSAEEIDRVKPIAAEAGSRPVRRSDITHSILTDDQSRWLRELAQNNRVRVCTFADEPTTMFTLRAASEEAFGDSSPDLDDKGESEGEGDESGQLLSSGSHPTIDFEARGAATDLGRAVRRSVETLGRSPIAGVVILTDGGINRGESAETIARYARDRRIPLHVVGIGDPTPPRNVRVAQIVAPENVFAEDPFAVVARIAGQGMAGESIDVELVERRADTDEEGRVVATKQVQLGADNAIEPVTFRRRQGTLGRFIYRVQVPVGEMESVADDNARQITVSVVENKLRVLLVSGAPSWEYRYLSRLLQRDATFELSCWLQSADNSAVRDGDVVIDHLPVTPEELFLYDAVILLDPDPLEFTTDFCETLARFVSRHGGGLLYEAARLNAPAFLRDAATLPVVRLLPVTLDPEADLVLNQIGHYQRNAFPIIVDPTAASHPILKLPEDGSAYNWNAIAEVYWHYPVLREKPVATVLMRHGDPRMQNTYGQHVLMATQYVGAGRTAFLAFDGTWRWRAAGDIVFDKFWVQTIRYLVEGKLAGGNRRGSLFTEKDAYQLGEAVTVSARLFDQSFKPLQEESVRGEYRIGDERGVFTLQRIADRPGWFEGRIAPSRTGGCELTLPIPDAELSEAAARREIQIVRPNLEIIDPRMDRERLVELAEQSFGGRYYDVREAGRIAKAIPDRHESTTIRSRPTPLWDDWWVLLLLIALLSIEWTMRKVFRLL